MKLTCVCCWVADTIRCSLLEKCIISFYCMNLRDSKKKWDIPQNSRNVGRYQIFLYGCIIQTNAPEARTLIELSHIRNVCVCSMNHLFLTWPVDMPHHLMCADSQTQHWKEDISRRTGKSNQVFTVSQSKTSSKLFMSQFGLSSFGVWFEEYLTVADMIEFMLAECNILV